MLQLESKQVLDADVTALADRIGEACEFQYTLTDGEHEWLCWIGDRYSVATAISDNSAEEDDGTRVLTITTEAIADALADDGVDRAPCLSEDTALARIVWLCCRHGE